MPYSVSGEDRSENYSSSIEIEELALRYVLRLMCYQMLHSDTRRTKYWNRKIQSSFRVQRG